MFAVPTPDRRTSSVVFKIALVISKQATKSWAVVDAAPAWVPALPDAVFDSLVGLLSAIKRCVDRSQPLAAFQLQVYISDAAISQL